YNIGHNPSNGTTGPHRLRKCLLGIAHGTWHSHTAGNALAPRAAGCSKPDGDHPAPACVVLRPILQAEAKTPSKSTSRHPIGSTREDPHEGNQTPVGPIIQFIGQLVASFLQRIELEQNRELILAGGKKSRCPRRGPVFLEEGRRYPFLPKLSPG